MGETLINLAKEKLTHLLEDVGRSPSPDSNLELICSGASGRVLMRCRGLIGIYWNGDRADNNSFLPAIKGLHAAKIKVPQLIHQWTDGQGNGACLVSDLGVQDILSFRHSDWGLLKEQYRKAFETLLPLYQLRPTWELQPAFDASLYRWEQEYFATHFLKQHMGMKSADDFINNQAFHELINFLCALPTAPIHRDCQSQNIMMHEGAAHLIDFQGMRLGRPEYDLASLIYDPYMDLTKEQRQELLSLWEEKSGDPLNLEIFTACAFQRIMQALGAFANIGYNQKRDWYLEKIPAALRSLQQVGELSPTHPITLCLKNALNL